MEGSDALKIFAGHSLLLSAPRPLPGLIEPTVNSLWSQEPYTSAPLAPVFPQVPPQLRGLQAVSKKHLVLWGAWDRTPGFVRSKQALYHLSSTPSPVFLLSCFLYTVISRPQTASAQRNSNATKAGTQEEEAGALFSSRTSTWPVSLLKITQMYFAKNPSQIIWHVFVNQQENKTHSEENMCIIFFFLPWRHLTNRKNLNCFHNAAGHKG